MKNRFILTLFLSLFTALVFADKAQKVKKEEPNVKMPSIPVLVFEKYNLPNGLTVVLHEDHAIPVVAVDIWYHVGAKNEEKGKTGFAHLFEHMMFQGSKNYDDDYFKPIQEVGGILNGSTSEDRTNYWEVVPSNYLKRILWLEADRMATLPDVLTKEKLDNQRNVVKNEMRQSYLNAPYGKAFYHLLSALFPPSHPYSWMVIGNEEDLDRASLEDVKAFFKKYYIPNNAVLTIAGDIDKKEVKGWIENYFGRIPSGEVVRPFSQWIPTLPKTIEAEYEDNVPLPRLYLAWPCQGMYQEDDPAMVLLAEILSGGKSSPLYQSLRKKEQLVQDVEALRDDREIASIFLISATAAKDKSLNEIKNKIDDIIKEVQKKPPSVDVLNRVKVQVLSNYIKRLEGLGGFGGVADILSEFETRFNDPSAYKRVWERYVSVTPEDIVRVARKYLDLEKRVELKIVPKSAVVNYSGMEKMPSGNESHPYHFPEIVKKTLSNGMKVWIVKKGRIPMVDVKLIFKGGADSDPVGKEGLVSLLSNMLDEGTTTKSGTAISDELDSLGANLDISSSWNDLTISLTTLKTTMDKAIPIMADIVMNPSFPEEEFKRVSKETFTGFEQSRNNPRITAINTMTKHLFGNNHPYGRRIDGDETTLKSLNPEILKAFYNNNYGTQNALLVIVGDIEPDKVISLTEGAFGKWKGKTGSVTEIPKPISEKGIFLVDRPDAPQSEVEVGLIGITRNDPDYYPLLVVNSLLGGQFVSRLNMNLREDKGYTYGARSDFLTRRGCGLFLAGAAIQRQSTADSIKEFLKEIKGVAGEKPITEDEIEFAKKSLIDRFPRQFEKNSAVASALSEIYLNNLPEDTIEKYITSIKKLTLTDVRNAAARHLSGNNFTIVVVGDSKKVKEDIEKLGIGRVQTVKAP